MYKLPFLVVLLLFSSVLIGQNLAMTRHVHQAFEVSEDVNELRFDFQDKSYTIVDLDTLRFVTDHTVEAWAGNTILVETNITISQGRGEILDYFIKQGRYQINFDSASASPLMSELQPKRKVLRTKEGACAEQIHFRILVPDVFVWEGDKPKSAIRKPESED